MRRAESLKKKSCRQTGTVAGGSIMTQFLGEQRLQHFLGNNFKHDWGSAAKVAQATDTYLVLQTQTRSAE